MDPATITIWTTAIAAAARLVVQELRWHRSQERARKVEAKRRRKLAKRVEAAKRELRRKEAGLVNEPGGSRMGREARAEWDREQKARQP